MGLPDFIIAGERRSGTTMLYEILKKHPQIEMYGKSDMDFFIEKELFSLEPVQNIESWDQYSNINDYKAKFKNPNGKIVGQKDSDLLWWKKSHPRISKHLTETKFIFILRNPINRAESQFWNEARKGREKRSFKKAIKSNFQKTDWENLHLEYLERGCYAKSLKHFFNYIPKNKCHVIVLENLLKNWKQELQKIAEFLNINIEEAIKIKPLISNQEELLILDKKYIKIKPLINFYDRVLNFLIRKLCRNKHKKKRLQSYFLKLGKVSKRKKNPLDERIIKELKNFYKPHNQELEKLLKISVSEWD